MGNTKKVKTAGRLGARYGVGIRKRLLKIEDKQERHYACPFCGFKKVRRKAAGIYACGKCKARFAGGAYLPATLPGAIIKKTVAQKGFASKGQRLEAEIEKAEEASEEGPKHGHSKERPEHAEKKKEARD